MEALAHLESLEIHTGNIHVGGKAKVPSVSTAKDVSDSYRMRLEIYCHRDQSM